jgi:hypothetical protein
MKRLQRATPVSRGLPASALAATALAVLGLPGSALAAAAPAHGVVLSVDRAHHEVQVIDSHHRVHEYRYRGTLGKLHTGSRLTFTLKGTTISSVSVHAGSQSVSFYGRVVRSSTRGVVLRLADGKQMTFSSRQVRKARKAAAAGAPGQVIAHMASPTITLNIQGLQPGVTVLVSENDDSAGNETITITLPPPSVPGVTATQTSTGVVADVETDSFLVQTADGSRLRLHMAQDTLAAASLSDCDTVSVTYHQDENLLIADGVQRTGTSTTGHCAPDQGDNGGDGNDNAGGDDGQVGGAITAVSSSALTIATTDGSMTFAVSSAAVTAGFQTGDLVEVSYGHAGADTLTATDV